MHKYCFRRTSTGFKTLNSDYDVIKDHFKLFGHSSTLFAELISIC